MKKSFGIYSIIWAICLGMFNLLTFVTPHEIAGYSKFTGTFWVGYIFITVTFVGQLICAFFAFKPESHSKVFYRISLVTVSYSALIAILVVGSIFMILPMLPSWIAIIICALVLAINIISVIKASAAVGIVEGVDKKIKANTFFVKELTIEASTLVNLTQNTEIKPIIEKVFEEIRYSDPMSAEPLADIEAQIKSEFKSFESAVKGEDAELVTASADALIVLIKKRNEKCKLLK